MGKTLSGICFIFVGFLGVATVALAAPQTLRVESGSTKFLAVGKPSLLKINGNGGGPKGDLTVSNNMVTGQLEVDMTSFKTGIDLRDDHMKNKYLEVEKYPKAVLAVKDLELPELDGTPKEVPFDGSLTLHGQTVPVKDGKVQLSKNGDKIKFNAKFKTDITSYKIDIPSYAGVKVADTVDVEVEAEALPTASLTTRKEIKTK